jgi:hypothetical protein
MKIFILNVRTTLLITMISMFSFQTISFADDYKFVGKFLLEYSIFKIDVYEISYFKSVNGKEKLVLDYKTNVKRKYSQEGWNVGLKHKAKIEKYQNKTKWLLDNTVDLAKGDKLSIVREKDKVTLIKNDKKLATIEDPLVAALAFEPWLGEKPVSIELKNSLLGLTKGK